MLLIADSGSTKTDWCLVNQEGRETYFSTEGYNPYFMPVQHIADSIQAGLPAYAAPALISSVYFYGAGCQDDKAGDMAQMLRGLFVNATHVSADVDLLAAARGLLSDGAGFAAILGTGTNTCLYDGRSITHHIDSLGFMLGDEGSGAAIGKRILSDFLRRKMPAAVRSSFSGTYGLSEAAVMHKVYKEPLPNRFCAGFTQFLTLPGTDRLYAQSVLRSAFTDFFTNLVSCYPGYREHSFNCVGSVGYHFQDILKTIAAEFGMETGIFTPDLIGLLVKHHRKTVIAGG